LLARHAAAAKRSSSPTATVVTATPPSNTSSAVSATGGAITAGELWSLVRALLFFHRRHPTEVSPTAPSRAGKSSNTNTTRGNSNTSSSSSSSAATISVKRNERNTRAQSQWNGDVSRLVTLARLLATSLRTPSPTLNVASLLTSSSLGMLMFNNSSISVSYLYAYW
jgi:hypothetical protein